MIKIVSVVSMCLLVLVILVGFFLKQRKKEQTKGEKLDQWIETHKKIIMGTILLVGILARVIGLGTVPKGLHIDEAGMAYDAYCIWEYGTDRYGNPYPLYFTNFGQGQSALCTYLISPFVGIFGINAWAIRLPIAFISIMAMVAMYVLVAKWKNTKMALFFLFLMAICPWHIMQARWGLDCNLLSSFLVFSMLAFSKAKKPLGYVGAGVVIGLTLYSYVLSYLIVPIFLGLTIVYLFYIRKITWKNVIWLGIPIFLLALPLMYMVLLNNHIVPKIDFPIISIPELPIYRIGELGLANMKDNGNLLFILFFGDDMMYNVPEGFGTLYYVSIPFTIIGFAEAVLRTGKSISKKQFDFHAIMVFEWIATCVCMLLIAEPKVNKANAAFIPMLYFTMLGIFYFAKELPYFFISAVLVYVVHFAIFETYYFTDFKNNTNVTYDCYFDDSLIELTQYLNQEEKYQNKKIHMELRTLDTAYYIKEPYIYTLIANNMTPEEFTSSIPKEGNKTSPTTYGKYTFYAINAYQKDTVYVLLHPIEKMLQEIKENGFVIEQVGDYYICYAKE